MKRSLLLLLVILVGGLLWAGFRPDGWFASQPETLLAGAPVRRGPLRISVTQRGELSARNSEQLRSEIQGRTTILYLIPEGTHVEVGDLVAELDASAITDRLVAQDIAVESAKATTIKAEQDRKIQVSQNQSDIARAEQALEFAELEIKKYDQGDWPQQLQQAEEDIVLATEELAQAKDTYEWSKKLFDKGFLTRTELERDDLARNRSEINLERAKRQKGLLERFDDPKKRAELQADLEEKKRELERVKLQAAARLVDYDSALKTSRAKLKLEQEKYDKLADQVAKAKIYAPVAGMVVYGRAEGGRMGGGDPIAEGTEVHERQEIATIPEPGGMIAEASLHESVIKKVEVGQPCLIRVDAIPNRVFHGKVEKVALLPDKQSWWANPNQRLFRTEVAIEDGDDDMRPGMSCSIEIIVKELADTLYVPVQAVFPQGNTTSVWVAKDGRNEPREVHVGASNAEWAAIDSGLQEGEIVLLAPPSVSQGSEAFRKASPAASLKTMDKSPEGSRQHGPGR